MTLDPLKMALNILKRLSTSPTWRLPSPKDSRPPQDGARRLPLPALPIMAAGSALSSLPARRAARPFPLQDGGGRLVPAADPRGPGPRQRPAAAPRLPEPQKGLEALGRPRGAAGPRDRRLPGGCGPAAARHGGLIAEQPDEGLFFVDTGNAEKDLKLNKGREKPLHIDLLLRPDSKVPAPKNILAYQVPNGGKERRRRQFWERLEQRGVLPRAERLLRARLRAAPPPREKPLEKGLLDPSRDFYDIWAENNPLDRALAGQDSWFLQETKKQRVKRPPRLQKKPSEVPAVEVIAPGGSYNPTFEDHQALLLRAHEVEVRKKREEEKVERQLSLPPAAEAPTAETVFQEQCEGLLEESGGEEEEEEKEEEKRGGAAPQDPPKAAVAPPRPGKKTEQQRRKEKEARALAVQRRQEAARRRGRQELFRLRALRRQLRRWEAERLRRRQAREAKLKALQGRPRRLGRLKYEDPSLEVQLSEELAESLRTLKPEGSVVHDRFKSLQKRSLIEPRERAKFKRKYRVKYVEKRAFREVTL